MNYPSPSYPPIWTYRPSGDGSAGVPDRLTERGARMADIMRYLLVVAGGAATVGQVTAALGMKNTHHVREILRHMAACGFVAQVRDTSGTRTRFPYVVTKVFEGHVRR